MEIVIPTLNEIEQVVERCLKKHFSNNPSFVNKQNPKEPFQDRIGLNEALQITGLKKATIYKLTMQGAIPHEKFRNGRLVFSRNELEAWMEQQTVRKQTSEEIAVRHLAEVASKRIRKANEYDSKKL